LSAGEILDNSHNDLIEDVLSSMATIFCNVTNEKINVLSVVNITFYDYCGMIRSEENSVDAARAFEVDTNALSLNHTYFVTDLIDEETGLLNIEDRRVFVTGSDGTDGDYLHWTVWSVSYPIIQLGILFDSSSDPINTNATRSIAEIQAVSDRIFASAVTNGVMDNLLKERSDDILVASLEGWEVETFVNAINRLKPDPSITGEEDDDGGVITSPQQSIDYVFWQPIRIAGFSILGLLFLSVGLLMKVGHERYKYDTWDASLTHDKSQNQQGEGNVTNVDISTMEGLDFILHRSHEARKQSPNLIVSPSLEKSTNQVSPDGLVPMYMGSKIGREHV
jgi:hypothetical protein